MRAVRIRRCLMASWLMIAALAAPSALAVDHARVGDVLRYALPASVFAYEAYKGDGEGLWQFGSSWAVTLGATEVLKRTTNVERPDGSDDMSFPSGHAAHAFAAATYMHRRHGFGRAAPYYVLATYVGWTRVNADRHRWGDIAGSAAVAGLSTWLLVDPKPEPSVRVMPIVGPDIIALQFDARF